MGFFHQTYQILALLVLLLTEGTDKLALILVVDGKIAQELLTIRLNLEVFVGHHHVDQCRRCH